jgi:hypothetical protein
LKLRGGAVKSLIRISDRTSAEDIAAWNLEGHVHFVLTSAASFIPGAQGLAISALRGFASSDPRISITCEFDEPASTTELEHTIFDSGFGFALVRLAKSISFPPSISPKSGSFKRLMGRLYLEKQGCLGSGKHAAILFVDPRYPFAPALKEDVYAGDPDFPPPSKFSEVLSRLSDGLGFQRLFHSTLESHLVGLVYELTRNSWEHGVQQEDSGAASSRALVLEKILFQSGDNFERFSDEIRSYLLRIKGGGRKIGAGVLCITVADVGQGIHKTLPSLPGETSQQRLSRAFESGQSRKPPGAVSRGMGLANAISAAFQLQSLFLVYSSDLAASQDFSTGAEKYPGVRFELRERKGSFDCGTCITIFIPEYQENPDQQRLFG